MREKNKEVVDGITINDGKVLLDGVTDITDRPMFNYIGFSQKGTAVFLRPSMFEDRSEGCCIIPEIDDDRVRYGVFRMDRFIDFCNTRTEAEKLLEICDEQQREAEHCKDEFPF